MVGDFPGWLVPPAVQTYGGNPFGTEPDNCSHPSRMRVRWTVHRAGYRYMARHTPARRLVQGQRYGRRRTAKDSMWWVWGYRSKTRSTSSSQPASRNQARSLAKEAGSQDT